VYNFYDYIRTIKPSAIRLNKTISLFVLLTCITATVIILSAPTQANDVQPSSGGGGGSYEKKTQSEQAKKEFILRRFISYYPVHQPY